MDKQRVKSKKAGAEKKQKSLTGKKQEREKDPESWEACRQRVHIIAHDFNNMLSSILANLQLAKTGSAVGTAGFERLNSAEEGVLRARELTGELLAISSDAKMAAPKEQENPVPSWQESSSVDTDVRAAPPFSFGTGPKNQRILLMDDEEAILLATSELLRFLSHEVSTANDGAIAVEMYKKALDAGVPFDAVILDITVPSGMGAKETMPLLHAIDPSVRAIISSGYSTDPMILDFSRFGFAAAVIKPYGFKELSEALDRALRPVSVKG